MAVEEQDDSEVPTGSAIIDHIYEILEYLDDDEAALKEDLTRGQIYIDQYSGIYTAVEFLLEQGYGPRPGLNAMDLAKFEQLKGHVRDDVLRSLGGRCRSLLREVEGEVHATHTLLTAADPLDDTLIRRRPEPSRDQATVVPVVQWVVLPQADNADLIAEIVERLERAYELAVSTNLPRHKAALTDSERAHLIAVLETTVALLREAPLVEKGLLNRLKDVAASGAAITVEKQSEVALGFVIAEVVKYF